MLKWILPGILMLWFGELSGLAAQTSPALSPSETAQIQAQIAQLEQLLSHTADRGAALFLMAKQYTQLGETSKAFPLLKECISLDEGLDIGEDTGTPVNLKYDVPFKFTGKIEKVTIDLKPVPGDPAPVKPPPRD